MPVRFYRFRFPIILLISLGIFWLAEHVWKSSLGITFKYILLVCVFLSLVLHFNQADKWLFHDLYSNGKTEIFLSFAENVKNANLTKEDVVAMGPVGGGAPELTMNYYTDSNFVYFDPNTIKNLLKENKLQWAFDQFGITKILGYDQKLSEEIIKTAKVQNIASLPCQ